MSVDKTKLEKLKKMLKVSDSIKMDQMRNALKMEKAVFDEKIFDWADEFGMN